MASRFVLPSADVGDGIAPSDGAQLFFFSTGTSTPKDTYSDAAATTPNTNPVIADANGVFPDIFISGTYKVQLKDKNGVQVGFGEADPVDSFSTITQSNTVYSTVAAMSSASIDDGVTVSTQGYTTAGDGGEDTFLIKTAAQAATDGDIIDEVGAGFTLANGNVAVSQAGKTINLLKFGAKGDGVTDDGPAIQALLDYFDAIGGGEVFVPPTSSFYLSNQTLVIYDNTWLSGLNKDHTKIKLGDSLDIHLLINEGQSLGVYDGNGISTTQNFNIQIRKINLDGNRANQTNGAQFDTVLFNNVRYGVVENSRIENGIKHNIEYWGCNFGRVHNNDVIAAGVTNVMIYRENNYCSVTNNMIQDAGQNGLAGAGVVVDNNSAVCTVANNTIEGSLEHGVVMEEGASGGVISGNTIDACGQYGIAITDGQTATQTVNITVTGNYVSNPGSHGVWISGGEQCLVSSNIIFSPSGAGVLIQTGNTHDPDLTKIIGNTVLGATSQGISVRNGDRCTVLGNTIEASGLDGIEILNASFNNVDGNTVFESDSGNTGGNIAQIKINGTCDRNIVSNNRCYNSSGAANALFGIWTASASVTNSIIRDNEVLNSVTLDYANNDTTAVISRTNIGATSLGGIFHEVMVAGSFEPLGQIGIRQIDGQTTPVSTTTPARQHEEVYLSSNATYWKAYGTGITQWKQLG